MTPITMIGPERRCTTAASAVAVLAVPDSDCRGFHSPLAETLALSGDVSNLYWKDCYFTDA